MAKTCIDCEESLDESRFASAGRAGRGYLNSYCRGCQTKRAYKYRESKIKPCSLCGGPKERAGRAHLCDKCKPWYPMSRTLRSLGITPDEYMAILKAQGYVCAICRQPDPRGRLKLDHDHGIGLRREAVRGALCDQCNRVRLGSFGDNVKLLAAAIHYLLYPPARRVLRYRTGSSPSGSGSQSVATVRTVRRSTRISR